MHTPVAASRASAAFLAFAATLISLNPVRAQTPATNPLAKISPANKSAPAQPSEDECIQFARAMEACIKQRDLKAFDRLIDWNAILNKATDSLGFPPQHRAGFHRGVMDSVTSDKGFAAQIASHAAAGGSYKFLRVRERGGQPSVLFRMVSDAGLNYHEWLLAKTGTNVLASDVYIYISGELLSDTFRRSALPLAKEASRSFIERLAVAESEYVKNIDQLAMMVDQMQQGRHGEALATYARLPEVLRREKGTLLMRYQAAAKTSEAELLQVVEDFRGYYPDDVCLDFLLVDYHVLRKEYDKVLEAIDRLDASVGGDAHLNLLRAESVYQQGDTAQAFELVRKANAADPDAIDPYWTLLGLAVMEKDHDKTLACLERLESRFGMNMSGVQQAPQYADFIASPEGQKWQRAHASAAGQPSQ
jgi:tetratricopeptide (TPR) repeat protein